MDTGRAQAGLETAEISGPDLMRINSFTNNAGSEKFDLEMGIQRGFADVF